MNVCIVCQKPKAALNCSACLGDVCKSCAQFLSEDSFSFLPKTDQTFAAGAYCSPCFDSTVAPALDEYNEMLERANNVNVYFKNQSKETRLIPRHRETLRVADCADRDETVLRLAFQAASKGFNTIVDVDVTSQKVRAGGGYQTSIWGGTALAANIDESKLPAPDRGSPN